MCWLRIFFVSQALYTKETFKTSDILIIQFYFACRSILLSIDFLIGMYASLSQEF